MSTKSPGLTSIIVVLTGFTTFALVASSALPMPPDPRVRHAFSDPAPHPLHAVSRNPSENSDTSPSSPREAGHLDSKALFVQTLPFLEGSADASASPLVGTNATGEETLDSPLVSRLASRQVDDRHTASPPSQPSPSPATPPLTVRADPPRGQAPLTVHLGLDPGHPSSHPFWQFGDGDQSSMPNPTHTYVTPGMYRPRVLTAAPDGRDIWVSGPAIVVYPPDGPRLLSTPNGPAELRDWEVRDEGRWQGPSNWQALEGVLTQSSNIWSPPHDPGLIPKLGTMFIYRQGTTWRNYRLSLTVQATDDDALGVVFRYQTPQRYYRFSWDRERRYRRLIKQVDGRFQTLAEDHVPYEMTQSYRVDLLVWRNAIEIRIDGQAVLGSPIFDIDDALSTGSIGLYTWYHKGARFQDLTVTAVEDNPEAPRFALEPIPHPSRAPER